MGAKPSAGQVVELPVQVSATSQGPALARHTAPALPGPEGTQTGAPVAQETTPSSHGLPVLHDAPGVQPLTHIPAPSQ
jgi:hypothetical protein